MKMNYYFFCFQYLFFQKLNITALTEQYYKLLKNKSMDWFLYDSDLRHETVNQCL